MDNLIEKTTGESIFETQLQDYSMYILTNKLKIHGATCITYPRLLKRISDYLEDDLVIIPSSIHEVLILPASITQKDYSYEELEAMITETNDTVLTDDEVLSTHAYIYEKDTGILRY